MSTHVVALLPEHGVAACVFRAGGRAWVGLAAAAPARPVSWMQVWSSQPPDERADVAGLLRHLRGRVAVVRRKDVPGGGVVVVGDYFVDGWEWWGPGNPAPLLPDTAATLSAAATPVTMGALDAAWRGSA